MRGSAVIDLTALLFLCAACDMLWPIASGHSGRYRLSRREVAAVCADLLGVDLAVGSVDELCQATAAACKAQD